MYCKPTPQTYLPVRGWCQPDAKKDYTVTTVKEEPDGIFFFSNIFRKRGPTSTRKSCVRESVPARKKIRLTERYRHYTYTSGGSRIGKIHVKAEKNAFKHVFGLKYFPHRLASYTQRIPAVRTAENNTYVL